MSGTTARSFTYANTGQVSQDARGGSTTYTFTYNNDGRIASAALNGSTVGTYAYNGAEQRVAKTTSTTTQDVYDRFGHLMSEDDGSGNLIREYIWLDDLPVALVDNTGMSPVTYYIHTDQVGRPQKMTDGSANLVWDAVYDPFGNVTSLSGSATNLLMFPGQLYDSETALAQNWNREYDSTLGRYIQSDPTGLAGGINTYAYAASSPVVLVDKDGREIIGLLIGGAIGGYAGYMQSKGSLAGLALGAAAGAAAGFVSPTAAEAGATVALNFFGLSEVGQAVTAAVAVSGTDGTMAGVAQMAENWLSCKPIMNHFWEEFGLGAAIPVLSGEAEFLGADAATGAISRATLNVFSVQSG